ncbi:MAG: ATP-binding protein [Candidatus Micrarchaeaceae archaeon]
MNVIGYLLNAEDVPLCVNRAVFRHHIIVSGGTGSGKSNTGANLVYQAARMGFTVFLYDAKPDYTLIHQPNKDSTVTDIWKEFEKYGLKPVGADSLVRVAVYGIGRARERRYEGYQAILSFQASDFDPEWLAALFFNPRTDYNQYEEFVGVCREFKDRGQEYTLDTILKTIEERIEREGAEEEAEQKGRRRSGRRTVHKSTAEAIIRKVERRRKSMPWLDSMGREVEEAPPEPRQLSFEQTIGAPTKPRTEPYRPERFIGGGKIVYIDLADVDADSYALFVGYFFRENQKHLAQNPQVRAAGGVVEFVDEAHRIFTSDTRYGDLLEYEFNRTMMEGRSLNHGVIISLQNASQVPASVLNNINTHIVMRQNNREVAKSATQTMGADFADQSIGLAPGQALCRMFGSTATVLVQMSPSPYELERTDNV